MVRGRKKNFKALTFVITCAMVCAVYAVSIGYGGTASAKEEVTLNIYATAGYIDFYKSIVVKEFAKAYPGIKVNYVPGKWDDLYSKLRTEKEAGWMEKGKTSIHLICLSHMAVAPYIEADLVQKFWPEYKEDLPNVDKLIDTGKVYLKIYDGYGIPAHVDYSPVMLRNPHKIKAEFTDLASFKDWVKGHSGKFQYAMPARSGPGRAFILGLANSLGEDLEHPETWVKTWDYLAELDSYIKYYDSSTTPTIRSFSGGHLYMVPLGVGWYADLIAHWGIPPDTVMDTKLFSSIFADPHVWCIPQGVSQKNVDAALKFINFELSDEMQARMGKLMHFPVTMGGWNATPKGDQEALTKIIGKSFPEFLATTSIVPYPSPEAINRMFDLWDERIGGK